MNEGAHGFPYGVRKDRFDFPLTELLNTIRNNELQADNQQASIGVHILPIAITSKYAEISQLENDRLTLFMGMRQGAYRVLQLFVPALLNCSIDLSAIGRLDTTELIEAMLEMIFPLAILDRDIRIEEYLDSSYKQKGFRIHSN